MSISYTRHNKFSENYQEVKLWGEGCTRGLSSPRTRSEELGAGVVAVVVVATAEVTTGLVVDSVVVVVDGAAVLPITERGTTVLSSGFLKAPNPLVVLSRKVFSAQDTSNAFVGRRQLWKLFRIYMGSCRRCCGIQRSLKQH